VDGFLTMRPTRAALGIKTETPTVTTTLAFREKMTRTVKDLKVFGNLIRLLGLSQPTASHFWKNALTVRKKNPSRLVQYFMSCSFAANLFLLRDEIQNRAKVGSSG
jgi:hypothetical protein